MGIYKIPEYEKLGISNDFMFGKIMQDETICKPFLEELLGFKILHIEYLEAQKTIDLKADARSVRFDIYVDDGKTIYNCEMQAAENKNLPKRSRYYQGMIDINLIKKGVDFRNLKKSFVIFICTFDPFGRDAYVYTFRNQCKEYPDLELHDETYKIFFNTKGKNGNISQELKYLLEYIQTSCIPEGCDSPLLKRMDCALNAARSNEEWRNDFMTLELKYKEKLEEGREIGIAEGRAEGREIGIKEGEARLGRLIDLLYNDKRVDDVPKIISDNIYRESLYKYYGI